MEKKSIQKLRMEVFDELDALTRVAHNHFTNSDEKFAALLTLQFVKESLSKLFEVQK